MTKEQNRFPQKYSLVENRLKVARESRARSKSNPYYENQGSTYYALSFSKAIKQNKQDAKFCLISHKMMHIKY